MIKVLFLALAVACFACNNDCPATAELAALRDSLSKSNITLNENPSPQSSFETLDAEKKELQLMFDAALARLDSLVGYNAELEKKLTERNVEIEKLKELINSRLKK